MGEGDTPDWHAPIVRFTAEDREVEAELDPTNDAKTFAIGELVPIAYQQGDPSNAVGADKIASGRAARWVALGLMLLLLAFGVALLSGKYGFRVVPSQ